MKGWDHHKPKILCTTLASFCISRDTSNNVSPPYLSMLHLGRNPLESNDALSPLMYVLICFLPRIFCLEDIDPNCVGYPNST